MDYVEETPPNYYFESDIRVIEARLRLKLPELERMMASLDNAKRISSETWKAEFDI